MSNTLNGLTDTANDTGSGVNSVAYYDCSGLIGACSASTPWTAIGAASSGPSWSASWTNQPASGSYRVVAVGTGNVGNVSSPSNSVPVTVSNVTPTVTVTYP